MKRRCTINYGDGETIESQFSYRIYVQMAINTTLFNKCKLVLNRQLNYLIYHYSLL